uniref:Uncharacterized protein n=1 Tax=Cyprinus carpio TaxID=7962 RepID=A0A8C1GVZ8_CYPCA
MALLGLSPPPAFLETPGELTIPFNSWIRIFYNYVTALGYFYTLTVADDGYQTALTALRAFFVQKVNVVAERNKFRQRAQRLGEPIMQYVAALLELLVNCEFGALADDMMRDQIVEKTCSPRIRECLLLETDLTLQKAVTIAGQIESAVAEAKAMESTETSVNAVHSRSREGLSVSPCAGFILSCTRRNTITWYGSL